MLIVRQKLDVLLTHWLRTCAVVLVCFARIRKVLHFLCITAICRDCTALFSPRIYETWKQYIHV